MSPPYVLVIDQGTTSTRSSIYDRTGRCLGSGSRELTQHFPQPGWVEHDPEDIWQSVAQSVPEALAAARLNAREIAALGITNQRETVVVWERAGGRALARAVVWQDRRTAEFCRQRAADEAWLQSRTGLFLDPYFSATKLHWLLEHIPKARSLAEAGELAAGTVDTFLIWRLTDGKVHATDLTNASRTLLLTLETGRWDDELCHYFRIPRTLLPEVKPSAADFGQTRGLGFLPDGIPIAGVAGDQQAALFGQGGFAAGDAKCTYGTGAFLLLHTGTTRARSNHRLLSTAAAHWGTERHYAIEGSVFVAGAVVQWLRDGAGLIDSSASVEALAERSDLREPVFLVPALTGLGAPHWAPEARGVIFGITRSTTAADLARSALEGVAYQVVDLLEAARQDAGTALTELRVDGGMTRNTWFLQRQADLAGIDLLRSPNPESTSLGAAYLAGLQVGIWSCLNDLKRNVAPPQRFAPRLDQAKRLALVADWRHAVQAVLAFYQRPAPVGEV